MTSEADHFRARATTLQESETSLLTKLQVKRKRIAAAELNLEQLQKEAEKRRRAAAEEAQRIAKAEAERQAAIQADFERELKTLFAIFDVDGSGFISCEELSEKLMTLGEKMSKEEVDELMRLADKDGSGDLTKEEVQAALHDLGFRFVKDSDVDKIFNRADVDKNGTIDFEEFVLTLCQK